MSALKLKHVAGCSYPTDETLEENKIIHFLFVSKGLTVNPLLRSLGTLFFSSIFEGGLNREGGLKESGGLFNSAKCINRSKVSRGRTCGPQVLYCFF